MTFSVVLIRHAQSQWNLENRFTGWADPGLTSKGLEEAERAARLLKANGYHFTLCYCSRLIRSRQTLDAVLAVLEQQELPIIEDWRLNERHYGALQGAVKTPEANNTTPEQIYRWRRGYLDKAGPLAEDDPRHPKHDPRYSDLPPSRLPAVENLAETRVRVVECWRDTLWPAVQAGESVLVSSHGNTLRALLMELAQMSVEKVESFEIPTGVPMILELDDQGSLLRWDYLKEAPAKS